MLLQVQEGRRLSIREGLRMMSSEGGHDHPHGSSTESSSSAQQQRQQWQHDQLMAL
jgi:hypothetical protein